MYKLISTVLFVSIIYHPLMGQGKVNRSSKFIYDSSFVHVGPNELLTYVAGKGKNTVIFEAGLGVDGRTWFTHDIFKTMAANNEVIAYNRSGYEPSTYQNDDRGIQELADDLSVVINAKATNRKIVLVGHSLGGAIIRTYAIQHPDRVKALLIIDPLHEQFTPYAKMTQAEEDTLVAQINLSGMKGAASEAKQLLENLVFLRSLPKIPNVPVIVLTSIKPGEGLSQTDLDNWAAAHESLGKGITKFKHIKTTKSGHFIYEEEPELVIKNLKILLK